MSKLYEALVRAATERTTNEEKQVEFPLASLDAPAAVVRDEAPGAWPQAKPWRR